MEQRRRQNARRSARRPAGSPDRRGPSRLDLSPELERIFSRLGWLLKNPAQRGRLLDDQALFLKAARRALREGIASETQLLALARRAGFDLREIDSDAMSTLKLAAGVEISVADDQYNSGAGSIVMVHPETLRVRLRRGQTEFRAGTALDAVCNSNRGMYQFRTVVRGTGGHTLHLEHTSDVQQVQRREHRRHDIEVPVELRHPDGTTHRTRTTDLSIGGAALRNPRRAFNTGSRVVVQADGHGSRISIPATVVRVSRGGKILHLRFGEISEATRHRLFRTIMSESQGRRRRR